MKIQHHLYTFLPEKKDRRGGAQTVFVSNGISADARTRLERHSLYERPDWLGPDEPLEKYPVSYGYFLLDETRGVLARVVYRGRHGIRAGNFLAHHIIFPLHAWEEQNPLLYIEDPVLFRGEFQEEAAPPRDHDLPLLPERELQLSPLFDLVGDAAERLLACAVASLLGQGKGPRVVVVFPPEIFAQTAATCSLALLLSRLLPRALRPAFTFRTYQIDPTEPKSRLVFVPSTTQLKTIKGDPSFLLFDLTGSPSSLPLAAREYARLVLAHAKNGEEDRVALIQDGFSSLVEKGLSPNSPVYDLLSHLLFAAEVSSEEDIVKVLDALEHADKISSAVIIRALVARVGATYCKALASGKLSSVGLRILALAAPEQLLPESKDALLGFAEAASQTPERAPWSEFFSVFSLVEETQGPEIFAHFIKNAQNICAALSVEQLAFVAGASSCGASLRLHALRQLSSQGVLASLWPSLEASVKQNLEIKDSTELLQILNSARIDNVAAEIFVKRVLPNEKNLIPLLPEAVETLRRAGVEDGEIGRRFLGNSSEEARAKILLFALEHGLLAAWRMTVSEQPISLLAAVEDEVTQRGKPGAFSEELARVGLWRQAMRLRLMRAKDPLSEVIIPALKAARTVNALEVIVDAALPGAESEPNIAAKILALVLERSKEAQFASKLEALAEKIYSKVPALREKGLVPASLLSQRSTRFWGARVLHNEMNRLPLERRRALLGACLEKITLVDGTEADLAESLYSVFSGATDERIRWLPLEAERVGLRLVARYSSGS